VRDRCTCSGSRVCHPGEIALDASHVIFLGRAAWVLSPGDEVEASALLADMLRATSCWQADRLWTSAMIRDDQIVPQLDLLGLSLPPEVTWDDYLVTYSDAPLMTSSFKGVFGGRHDEDLLRRATDSAANRPTLLVTNDETLFEQARQPMFADPPSGLYSENSTSMMLRLLSCGAVTEDVVVACLAAEHKNVEQLERDGMSGDKYERKMRRLDRANQELVQRQFDADWSPDQPTL
jgi:hypothetical protein